MPVHVLWRVEKEKVIDWIYRNCVSIFCCLTLSTEPDKNQLISSNINLADKALYFSPPKAMNGITIILLRSLITHNKTYIKTLYYKGKTQLYCAIKVGLNLPKYTLIYRNENPSITVKLKYVYTLTKGWKIDAIIVIG